MNMNAETKFLLKHGIKTLEEIKKLNDYREALDLSLLIGESTIDELYNQANVEIDIFLKCREIMEKENKKDIDTLLLIIMLFDRINNMFAYLFFLFPTNKMHVKKYFKFCLTHISLTQVNGVQSKHLLLFNTLVKQVL